MNSKKIIIIIIFLQEKDEKIKPANKQTKKLLS